MRLAIVQGIFSRYHLARLKALKIRADWGVVEVEVVGGKGITGIEGWRTGPEAGDKRVTIYPNRDYGDLTAEEIVKGVSNALTELNPNVVTAFGASFPDGRAAILWCRRNQRGLVLMSDSNEWDYKRTWWKEAVKRRMVKLCDAALVAAEPQAEYIAKLGMPREKIFLGYDAVDNAYFSDGAETIRKNMEHFRRKYSLPGNYFLSSNRFIPKKNLFRLVEAYAQYRLRTKNPWGMVLLGDGELILQIRRHIDQLNLQEHVVLPGFKQYEELPVYYGLAGCYIQASIIEQWGLAVNEAMASGLPVLVSKKAGCASVLVEEGKNGWTFDPTSVGEMTDVLVRMHNLSSKQRSAMGQRSREIISNWGPERFAQGLLDAVQAGLAHAQTRKPGLRFCDRLLLKTLDYVSST